MTNHPTELELNSFNNLLDEFNISNKLERNSLKNDTFLPEGEEWLLELISGENQYIHRCSYTVNNPEVYYIWVDFSQENGVTIEINYKDKTAKKFTIISPSEVKTSSPV
jgi:predicted choloylglycine hydrolase